LRAILLLLLQSRVSGLLWLLLLRRLVASRLRLLEALKLLLVLRRIARRLRLKSSARVAGILLLERLLLLLLLLTEASWLLRLERRWLALEARRLWLEVSGAAAIGAAQVRVGAGEHA